MRLSKSLVFLVLLLAAANCSFAQQGNGALSGLNGAWQMQRLEYKVFSKSTNQLLETKTIDRPDVVFQERAFLPVFFLFRDSSCVMKYNGGMEKGSYQVKNNEIVFHNTMVPASGQPTTLHPEAFFTYTIVDNKILMITNQGGVFYQDTTRNIQVKMTYSCYYQKLN